MVLQVRNSLSHQMDHRILVLTLLFVGLYHGCLASFLSIEYPYPYKYHRNDKL